MVLLVIVGATCFTGIFMTIGGGDVIRNVILGLNFGKWGTYIIMMVVYLSWVCLSTGSQL